MVFDSSSSSGTYNPTFYTVTRENSKRPYRVLIDHSMPALSLPFPDFLARSCPRNLQRAPGQILLHLRRASRTGNSVYSYQTGPDYCNVISFDQRDSMRRTH